MTAAVLTQEPVESGVEFLGSVLAHWQVRPAVTLARVLTSTVDKKSYEGEAPVRLCNYTDVYYNDRIDSAEGFMQATATAEQIAKFSVRSGDVVFTKDSESPNDIGIPAYVNSDLPGVVYGYHLGVYRPSDARYGRFLRYVLESSYAKAQFEARTAGTTRVGLSQSTIRYLSIPTPPPAEAVAIADYLDRETAQIDAFIAKNDELVRLLNERRAATVVRLVTRGNNSGDLAPSGVPLADQMPSHWRAGNIRRFASMRTGHTPSRQVDEYWIDCDIPWFTLADVWQLRQGRRYLGETKDKISTLGLENSAAELLPAGTVALSRTASVGFVGIMPIAMATSQDFWNWVPGPELSPEYLCYQLQAMRPEFERLMIGSTHRTIYQADAASLTLLVPPLAEQHAIVKELDERLQRIDAAIGSAKRAVALTRERRAALISAAETGKIDVGVRA